MFARGRRVRRPTQVDVVCPCKACLILYRSGDFSNQSLQQRPHWCTGGDERASGVASDAARLQCGCLLAVDSGTLQRRAERILFEADERVSIQLTRLAMKAECES